MTGPAAPPPPLAAAAAERPALLAAATDPFAAGQAHLRQIRWTPPPLGARPLVAVLDTGVDPSSPDLAGVAAPAPAALRAGEPRPVRRPPGPRDPRRGHHRRRHGERRGRERGWRRPASSRSRSPTRAAARPPRRWCAAWPTRRHGGAGHQHLVRRPRLLEGRAGRHRRRVPAGRPGRRRRRQHLAEAPSRSTRAPTARCSPSPRWGPPGGRWPSPRAGPQVALAAPGEDPVDRPRRLAGPRAPDGHLDGGGDRVGAAARIIAARPGLTAQQVREILETTARDLPPAGPRPGSGAGALDLAAALAAPDPPRGDPEPNDDPVLAAALDRSCPRAGRPGARRAAHRVVERPPRRLRRSGSRPASA